MGRSRIDRARNREQKKGGEQTNSDESQELRTRRRRRRRRLVNRVHVTERERKNEGDAGRNEHGQVVAGHTLNTVDRNDT